MKKTLTVLILPLMLLFSTLQGAGATARQEEKVIAPGDDSALMTRVIIGRDLVKIEETDSGLKVRVFDNGISILESLEGKKKVEFDKYENPPEGYHDRSDDEIFSDNGPEIMEDSHRASETEVMIEEHHGYYRDDRNENDDREKRSYNGARSFRGHLSGVNFGYNGYLVNESTEMPEEISYMETNTGKSLGGSLFFTQADIGLTRHIGFVTGAGITWNNYFFKNHNSIDEGEEGTIIGTLPGEEAPVKRSKFATLYLEIPLLLEIQLPAGYSKRLNVAAGVTGGLRLNAWTKTVFKDGEKTRSNGDYNLNLLRGGATARVGFENFMIYGTYYLTPWFRDYKGPSGLNPVPFEIGLSFTVND